MACIKSKIASEIGVKPHMVHNALKRGTNPELAEKIKEAAQKLGIEVETKAVKVIVKIIFKDGE